MLTLVGVLYNSPSLLTGYVNVVGSTSFRLITVMRPTRPLLVIYDGLVFFVLLIVRPFLGPFLRIDRGPDMFYSYMIKKK